MIFQLRWDKHFSGEALFRYTFIDGLRAVLKPGRKPSEKARDQDFYCDTSRGQRWIDGEILNLAFKRGEFRQVQLRRGENA
jgi:hypothetical protein